MRFWFFLGAVNGLIAVAAGAIGAHALQARVPPGDLAVFETAARYHAIHALALLAVAWAGSAGSAGLAHWAGGFFLAGIVLFSGSLYLIGATGSRALAAAAPFGGAAFLIGWAVLAAAGLKLRF